MINFLKAYSIHVFVTSILLLLVVPGLLMQGMFMDGEQYACVSSNLYNGSGTFWRPILSQTWYMNGNSSFMEHPPLFYWLESRVFFVFGDSIYSERIFSIIMLFFNAFILHKVWQLTYEDNNEYKKYSWLPILLWIITPICFWTFQNNMIEMVVSFFVLLAIFFSYKGAKKEKNRILNLIIGGVFVFLGFLTKGFATLFPLIILLVFVFCYKEKMPFRKMLFYNLLLVFVPLFLIMSLVMVSDDARNNLHFYITERVISRLETTPTTNYRLLLLYDLLSELIPILCICLLFYVLDKKNKFFSKQKKINKHFLFFFVMGCAGSLPLMLTLVQKKFYFMPSIAFFALAFSCLIIENISSVIEKTFNSDRKKVVFSIVSTSLLVIAILVSILSVGKYSRDKEIIEDTNIIGNYLKKDLVVSSDIETYYSWSFHFYLLRRYDISLDPNIKRSKYFITKRKKNEYFEILYKKVDLPTKDYHLYVTKFLDN